MSMKLGRSIKPINYALAEGGRRRHNMRKAISWIRQSRKRTIGAVTTALVILGAGSAMAYFVLIATGSGSQTTTLGAQGAGQLDISVTGVPDAMIPGQCTAPTGVQAWASNPDSSNRVTVTGTNVTFQVDGQPAPTGYFTWTDDTQAQLPETLDPLQGTGGTHGQPINIADGMVCFHDTGQDQSAVAGHALTTVIAVH